MKPLHTYKIALTLAATMLFANGAQATIIPLNALLNGPQANAGLGTGSPGTGTASLTLDDTTNTLSWNVSWSGLLSSETGMHFHGPALPNQNASVQLNIGAMSGLTSPSIGSFPITAPQANDLLAGLWYINIHTTQFPGGEIRGQILPEPATLVMFGGVASMLMLRRKRLLTR